MFQFNARSDECSVEAAVRAENRRQLSAAFSEFDSDGSGTLSVTELRNMLRALGHNPCEAQLEEVMNRVGCQQIGLGLVQTVFFF